MKTNFKKLEESKEYTFEEAAKNWLQNMMVITKESTYSKYSILVKIHLLPDLRQYKLKDLNSVMLEQYLYKKWKEGRLDGKGSLAPSTVRLLACILQSILRFAKQIGYIDTTYGTISKPKLILNEMELNTIRGKLMSKSMKISGF